MAEFFEVSEQTVNTWKEKHPDFLESLKKGKSHADGTVAEKLFHRATGYEHPEDKIFNNGGEAVIVPTIKHYPPDTTAAIFWLKNRRPDIWRDVQKTEITGKDGGAIEIDSPREEIDRRIAGIAARLREKESAEGAD